MNPCACCFEDSICACIPEDGFLIIHTILPPSQQLYYHLTDKFGNVYSDGILSEADGSLKIPMIDLPDGIFTPFSGAFNLVISSDADGCAVVPLLLASRYSCINFSVDGGNTTKNSIGCKIGLPALAII